LLVLSPTTKGHLWDFAVSPLLVLSPTTPGHYVIADENASYGRLLVTTPTMASTMV
jgi:hypothetical protein